MTSCVHISGYSLLSCLPQAQDLRWQALNQWSAANVNAQDFAPYFYHPLQPFAIEEQVIQQSDRRMMGKTMQAAAMAAGQALALAGLKNHPECLEHMQIITALRGGDTDAAANAQILADMLQNPHESTLNAALMQHTKPTLFLSQLPNLLASNLAIIYGISGSSLTLMGEEMAGAQAIELAYQRIQSGQVQRVLVNAVSVNESFERMQVFAAGKLLCTETFLPVLQRQAGGICLGSAAACLILESAESLAERKGHSFGQITQVSIKPYENQAFIQPQQPCGVISMTSGDAALIKQEQKGWHAVQSTQAYAVRNAETVLGSIFEAALPAGIILALECLQQQCLFAPLDLQYEQAALFTPQQMYVHCLDHNHQQALIRVEAK